MAGIPRSCGTRCVDQWVVEPVWRADSIGLQVVDSLDGIASEGALVQPRVDIVHGTSFVFVGRRFQYAVYAPDHARRWELAPYLSLDRIDPATRTACTDALIATLREALDRSPQPHGE